MTTTHLRPASATTQAALFELVARSPRTTRSVGHAAELCDGTCVIHVMLPNMGYACGETILTVDGHMVLGSSQFADVTCPGCRAQGVARIRWRMCRQQERCVLCRRPAIKDLPWCKTCEVAA